LSEGTGAYETGSFDTREVDPTLKLDERGYVYISADIFADVGGHTRVLVAAVDA
jgi:hypothetical protein